jgi:methylmalonyl-CoA mutase N-terminal domain/subunit
VTSVVDPLGGSYFIERLTKDMVDGTYRYFDVIDRLGGMVDAIEQGFPQREISESAYRFQQAVERKEQIIVGVNAYVDDDASAVPTLYIDERAAEIQAARLARVRATRSAARVRETLAALQAAARGTENTMDALLDCVRAYATVGEMCDALRVVWGEYEEAPSI